jgi:exodeoxyribonuclease-5
MKLTDEQKYVIKEILQFKKNVIKLGGLAGAGKSTVIQHLSQALPNFAVCAYTGKAVNVLRKKGLAATTIHSLIYKAFEDDGKVRFALANDISCEGVIVDEASMVSRDIFQDLHSFRKPLIFVGDHGQLEPIGDKSFNLMEVPDYKLETIHRNAGEIAHFANYIREGYKPSAWQHRNGTSDKIKFISKSAYKELVSEVDQVICAFNKTRAEINVIVRDKLERVKDFPQIGDRVICLRNNTQKGLFNGMQGFIGWFNEKNRIQFVSDGYSIDDVIIDPATFNKVKYEFDWFSDMDSPNPFDYAYAITCHKAQGDEFNSVLVLEQRCDLWSHPRWCYTAASRAKEKLSWCVL